MLRAVPKLCLLSISLFPLACGASSPPDQSASEAQIRRVVVNYNLLAAQGRGEEACKLKINQKMAPAIPHISGVPENCSQFVDWFGPRMSPQVRQIMLDTQVATVNINGNRATATTTNGARMDLRWVDGTWKLT
jgi:hypothetical protein